MGMSRRAAYPGQVTRHPASESALCHFDVETDLSNVSWDVQDATVFCEHRERLAANERDLFCSAFAFNYWTEL
jgi:hypothetical protein